MLPSFAAEHMISKQGWSLQGLTNQPYSPVLHLAGCGYKLEMKMLWDQQHHLLAGCGLAYMQLQHQIVCLTVRIGHHLRDSLLNNVSAEGMWQWAGAPKTCTKQYHYC